MNKVKKFLRQLIPGYELSKKIYRRYKFANFLYRHKLNILANICTYRTYRKYHCQISHKAIIGENVEFLHPIGVVIGEGTIIGKNVAIYQNVIIGRKRRDIIKYPVIENNVTIYGNTTIMGDIKIGSNVVIGCNSVVMRSIEENSKCYGLVK